MRCFLFLARNLKTYKHNHKTNAYETYKITFSTTY
mgnify:CR=1 FL=1